VHFLLSRIVVASVFPRTQNVFTAVDGRMAKWHCTSKMNGLIGWNKKDFAYVCMSVRLFVTCTSKLQTICWSKFGICNFVFNLRNSLADL